MGCELTHRVFLLGWVNERRGLPAASWQQRLLSRGCVTPAGSDTVTCGSLCSVGFAGEAPAWLRGRSAVFPSRDGGFPSASAVMCLCLLRVPWQ